MERKRERKRERENFLAAWLSGVKVRRNEGNGKKKTCMVRPHSLSLHIGICGSLYMGPAVSLARFLRPFTGPA